MRACSSGSEESKADFLSHSFPFFWLEGDGGGGGGHESDLVSAEGTILSL